jgi:hypothetical protein
MICLPCLSTFAAHGKTIAGYCRTASVTTRPSARHATSATGTTNRNAGAPHCRVAATTAAACGQGK